MLVRSDDRIYRVQGRWIDMRGKEMPVHVTYLSAISFLGSLPLTFVIATLVLPFSFANVLVYAAVGSASFAMWVRKQVNADRTPLAVLQHLYLDVLVWAACRAANAAAHTARRPHRPSAAHVKLREN